MKKIFLIFLFLCCSFFGFIKGVSAGCEATISPSSASVGSTVDFNFSIHNTGDNPIVYVKIPTNLGGYIYVTGSEASGWDMSPESDANVFVNGAIEPGSNSSFIVHGNTAGTNASVTWTPEASESDAALAFSCNTTTINLTGEAAPTPTPEVTIPPVDVIPPGISGVAVSAGSTTATITWRLDSAATTMIYYGTTTGYGSTASTTSESVALSSLSPSTVYYYEIQATNDGGTSIVTGNTFTTAASGSTTSTTSTSTSTTTTINTTSTVTKTVVLTDTTKPIVQISTKTVKAAEKAPKIEGVVTDNGLVNAGISKIQYSVDSGKNWLFVSEPGGTTKAIFSFIPDLVDDDNYPIKIRAIDKSGNIGISSTFLVIIDRIPPRIIHTVWHVGPLLINDNGVGKKDLVAGVPVRLVVQGVGGITKMELFLGSQKFPLNENKITGYWDTTVLLNNGGEWDAIIKAVDGGGSTIEKKIGVIFVHSNKSKLPPHTISTIWKLNDLTGQFHIWNGSPYSQSNPRIGDMNWFLPPGTYYMSLVASGYNSAVSTIFSLSESKVISVEPKLEKWNVWGLLGVTSQFEVAIPTTHSEFGKSLILGKRITWLDKKEWEGKESVISIIPLWDPSAATRFTALSTMANQQADVPNIVIIPGANASTVELLKNRGHYASTFVADPDGNSLEEFPGMHIPLTIRVNRKGMIMEVVILK